MSIRVLLCFIVLILGLSVGTALANPPNPTDNGQQAPPCHGHNNEDCRPDPQPEHGQDCRHSDDHVCETPTPTPPTATPVPPTNTPVPPTATPVPPTPTATSVPPTATPPPSAGAECIPCGEASAPTATPTHTPTPAVIGSAITQVAPSAPPQVLGEAPTLLPRTGDVSPVLLGGLGLVLALAGWVIRKLNS